MKKKLLMMGISGLSFLVSTKGFSQAPVADFSIDQPTTCVNMTVQLTDMSTNSPTAWSYTVEGSTGTLTAQNPTLSFNAPGGYNVSLVATNASGTSAPVSKTITVNGLPTLTVAAAATVCAGGTISLNASGATSYTWSNGVANSNTFAPSATADYTVTGIDANNCKNTAVQSITVNPVPSLTLSGTSAICLGSSLTQTVSGADTYAWSTGTGGDNINETPTADITYTVTGTYTLTGCSSNAMKLINVDAFPTVTVSDATVCAGSVFTISPTGAANYTYSTGSNTVIPAGNDSYTITGASLHGCAAVAQAVSNVTVNALPTLTVSSGTICAGDSFTLSPTGATTYTYLTGANVVTPAATAAYSVTGTGTNGCVSAITVANVTVNALPTLTVSSGSICSGQSFTLSPTGATTYTYLTGANVVTPAATTAYSVTGTGTNGCVSAITVANVTVNAIPTLTVNNGTVCSGTIFTISPAGASTYVYSNGSNTVAPTSSQSYTVTGTDSHGCVSAATIFSITVNSLPAITAASGTICAGASYTITAGGASTYTYTGGSNVVAPASTDSYSVTGTDLNGCVSAAPVVVTVVVAPHVTLSVSGSTVICAGSAANLTANGAVSYVWNNGVTVNTVALSPLTNTSYTVAGTNGACSDTAIVMVSVNPLPTVSASALTQTICMGETTTLSSSGADAYSWNSGETTSSIAISPTVTTTYTVTGTTASTGCSAKAYVTQEVSECTGIAKQTGSFESGIYPNPNKGAFVVKVTQSTSIRIINIIGQSVYAAELAQGENSVSLNDQVDGIYFVQLQQGSIVKTMKVIKN